MNWNWFEPFLGLTLGPNEFFFGITASKNELKISIGVVFHQEFDETNESS